jgi:hypothetical protein
MLVRTPELPRFPPFLTKSIHIFELEPHQFIESAFMINRVT